MSKEKVENFPKNINKNNKTAVLTQKYHNVLDHYVLGSG